jgi:hypothetical protein
MNYLKVKTPRAPAYLRFVAQHDCFACGVSGYSQAAHPNQGRGLGQKSSDLDAFPLCCARPGHQGCHILFDQLIDITLGERRELEKTYTARMHAIARAAGRPEFKEAA